MLCTLAPERSGAIEFIRRATAAGVVIALGHTAARGCDSRGRSGRCPPEHSPGQRHRADAAAPPQSDLGSGGAGIALGIVHRRRASPRPVRASGARTCQGARAHRSWSAMPALSRVCRPAVTANGKSNQLDGSSSPARPTWPARITVSKPGSTTCSPQPAGLSSKPSPPSQPTPRLFGRPAPR